MVVIAHDGDVDLADAEAVEQMSALLGSGREVAAVPPVDVLLGG